jgi:hypothetical protein
MEYDYSSSGSLDPVTATILTIVYLVVIVVAIAALWKMFAKAGEPGWAAIVPFYNVYTEFKIAGMNPWMFLLMFIPVVNIVIGIMMAIKLGERFGKGGAWSFFLLVLIPIGYLILGFGKDPYLPLPQYSTGGYAPAGLYNPPPAPPAPPAGPYNPPPAPPAPPAPPSW